MINNIIMDDKFTIITPSYNSEQYIDETIKSVISQTYQNWELIIIDDDSSDNSVRIIENYVKKDNRIILIKLSNNRGPAIARNTGITLAKGRYIAFLDSDDIWLPEKLSKQLHLLNIRDLPFTCSAYNVINESGEIVSKFIPPKQISYNSMLKTSSIGCSTVVYDTWKLGKLFMPNLQKQQDYVLWLTLIKKIDLAEGTSEVLANYRLRDNSVSSNKIKCGIYQWKIYRKLEQISLLKSSYYFIHYVINGLTKYRKCKIY